MLSLQSLPLDQIFSLLDLKDVVRCRRVSALFKWRVDQEFLPTIRQINEPQPQNTEKTVITLRCILPMKSRIVCDLSNMNAHLFLRFLAKYCPGVCSIYAPSVAVNLVDISPLASRLVYFYLEEIVPPHNVTLDAALFIATFPRLNFFQLKRSEHLCRDEVTKGYHLQPVKQFAQFSDSCGMKHFCPSSDEEPSLPLLMDIDIRRTLTIDCLHPSSLHSLRFIAVGQITFKDDASALQNMTLPNLLIFHQRELSNNLLPIIKLLCRSPELKSLHLEGEFESEELLAVKKLLTKCLSLRIFKIWSRYNNAHIKIDPNDCLDTRQCKRLEYFRLSGGNFHVKILIPSACYNHIEIAGYNLIILSGNETRQPLHCWLPYWTPIFPVEEPKFTGKLKIPAFIHTRIGERWIASHPNMTCCCFSLSLLLISEGAVPVSLKLILERTAVREVEIENVDWQKLSDIKQLQETFTAIAEHPNRSLSITYDRLSVSRWRSISDSRKFVAYLARKHSKTKYKLCPFGPRGFKLLTGSFADAKLEHI